MATDSFTRRLSHHLARLMEENDLKLDYVASCAGIGIETVRRIKNGEVRKLWDRTAGKLAQFIETESGGTVTFDRDPGRNPNLLHEMIEGNKDGVYAIQEGRIVFSNTQVEAITGYTSEELSSQTYTRFLDQDSRTQEQERRLRRSKGMPLSDRYEVAVIRKDGNCVRAETQIARFYVDGKKTALGTIRQVTDQ